ncbi:DNA polymerase eta subunit [Blastomyces gilchristii SLH14081]|uniref:DNA polymerase eta n=1 Tax=Blastomyces gilchristii (strain SLH14081) TaxID=559298 RepID=A0A179UBL3_BLAGS|nr:DNA polymerase eta subunit [Blastomyces gilchristii SLH14081]OAT04698.1 DNA polymerase eta subunit [Blastomyces gilchristii SLH14081]
MSLPQPTTSRFTHRHLTLLRASSPRTPLRIIAHIDLDAFYAQCEMVRLNTPRTQPLAVQQWESLIAVNYAARAFNITRMLTAAEARKRCPQLVTQHVATFREGEGAQWKYRDDAAECVATDKVSLEPYRVESRRILEGIRAALAAWAEGVMRDVGGGGGGGGEGRGGGGTKNELQLQLQQLVRVEKAGIDEVFVDLSALVYETLLDRHPMLREGEVGRDMSERLPRPPTTVLEWGKEDMLVDLDAGQAEEDDPDWDDVCMLIGADIVRSVRATIWERLKYTCSAGIARNKMMAKLGSACNKPNKQTIVRNRAVQQFLGGFKFTQIRMLGGKLGKQVAAIFGTDEVGGLLHVPVEQLRLKLGDDTGTWLYELLRGYEYSEVSVRTQIKSMLSTKSFRPGIQSSTQAEKWLRIFVADIYGRLLEEGVLENKRRPKVITIHHRTAGQTRSRQIPIPTGRPITDTFLFDLAKTLLAQVVNEGNIWPCANLSLNVSGFEDGVTGNQRLDSFFLRGTGDTKVASAPSQQQQRNSDTRQGYLPGSEPQKRRKAPPNDNYEDGHPRHDHSATSPGHTVGEEDEESLFLQDDDNNNHHLPGPANTSPALTDDDENALTTQHDDWASVMGIQEPSFTCPRCAKTIAEYDRSEHDDWHFAKDLYTQERREQRPSIVSPPRPRPRPRQQGDGSRGRGRGGGRGKFDKRQRRLAF